MNSTTKNIVAVIVGLIVGGVVNLGIVKLGASIVPPPPDVDVMNLESLKANMHLFETRHFIPPFLAHALGTLAGAFIAAKMAITNKIRLALVVGLIFLIGGIVNVYQLPSPTWFGVGDVLLAYIPMAWIGGKLAGNSNAAQAV